jgi:hypothetical protein
MASSQRVFVQFDDESNLLVEIACKFSVGQLLAKICKLKHIQKPHVLLSEDDLCLTRQLLDANGHESTVLYMPDAEINLESESNVIFRVVGCLKQHHGFSEKLKKYHKLVNLFTSELEQLQPSRYCYIAIFILVKFHSNCSCDSSEFEILRAPLSSKQTVYEEVIEKYASFVTMTKNCLNELQNTTENPKELSMLGLATGTIQLPLDSMQ